MSDDEQLNQLLAYKDLRKFKARLLLESYMGTIQEARKRKVKWRDIQCWLKDKKSIDLGRGIIKEIFRYEGATAQAVDVPAESPLVPKMDALDTQFDHMVTKFDSVKDEIEFYEQEEKRATTLRQEVLTRKYRLGVKSLLLGFISLVQEEMPTQEEVRGAELSEENCFEYLASSPRVFILAD